MCMFCCTQKHPVVLGGFEPAVYVRDSEFWVEFYPVTLDQTLYGPLEGKLYQEMHTQIGHSGEQ